MFARMETWLRLRAGKEMSCMRKQEKPVFEAGDRFRLTRTIEAFGGEAGTGTGGFYTCRAGLKGTVVKKSSGLRTRRALSRAIIFGLKPFQDDWLYGSIRWRRWLRRR